MPSIVLPPKPTALQKPHINLAVVGHALRDMGRTIAAGQIVEVKPAQVQIK